MTFFRAGGYPIFLVLLFTVLLLFVAGRYALKPHPRGLALIRALTLTLVFSAVAGVATNIRATLYGVTNRWEMNPETPLAVMRGLGESLTPAVLGFTALSIAWLFVAVGERRRDDLQPDTD